LRARNRIRKIVVVPAATSTSTKGYGSGDTAHGECCTKRKQEIRHSESRTAGAAACWRNVSR
jgi:hypothetical protein